MQQKQIEKMQQVMIHQNVNLARLKSKLDIDQLKNVPTNLSNLESKVDKLDVDKLVPVPADLSDLVKNDVVKI